MRGERVKILVSSADLYKYEIRIKIRYSDLHCALTLRLLIALRICNWLKIEDYPSVNSGTRERSSTIYAV